MRENLWWNEKQKKSAKSISSRHTQLLIFKTGIPGLILHSNQISIQVFSCVLDSQRLPSETISRRATIYEMCEIRIVVMLPILIVRGIESIGWRRLLIIDFFETIRWWVSFHVGGILVVRYMHRVMRIGIIISSVASLHWNEGSSKIILNSAFL